MMDIMEKIRSDLRYSVLRTSLNKYETPPFELPDEKLIVVIQQVEKEHEIQTKILSSKEAMDVILTEESVERSFKEVRDRYENEQDFYHELYKNNLDEAQFRASLAREIKVETILDRVTADLEEVSDVDVMIYYHMHQQKIKKPEIRKARHILITINDDYLDNTREKSLEKAQQILENLKKKPKKFSEYALKYSECPTAYQGGVLGDVKKGVLYKELEEVLFTLKEKQFSAAVESPIGFHILCCDEIQKPKTLSAAEATPMIRNLLAQRRKEICQQAWLSKIMTGDNNG